MTILWLSTRYRMRLLLASLLLVGPLYVAVRASEHVVRPAGRRLGQRFGWPGPCSSLEYRFMCENLLTTKALAGSRFSDGAAGVAAAVYFDRAWRRGSRPMGCGSSTLGTKGFVGLDPVLHGHNLASRPLHLAISGATLGRPSCGGWLARRRAVGSVYDRLPVKCFPKHHLHHARRWAHGLQSQGNFEQSRPRARPRPQTGPASRQRPPRPRSPWQTATTDWDAPSKPRDG